jgi:thioredoxin 1
MAELKIEVFTSPTCPHCPSAVRATKELLEENPELKEKVAWVEVSTATADGSRRAREYGIRGVPTIIFTNSNGEKGGVVGTPTKKKYLEIIKQMMT